MVDGNYLLSLDFDKPKDAEAFESIMEALEVSPRFLFKSLENLLRMMQHRSLLSNHPCWSQQQEAQDVQSQQLHPSMTLQDPPTSTPDAPPTSLGVAARRYAGITATGKQAKTPEPITKKPDTPVTSLGVAAHRRYVDVVASGKQSEKPKEAKTNQVLFWTPRGSESIRIGPASLVDPCPQTERLWKNLTEIVLSDYTADTWARNIETNATIHATDERGVNEIAHLIRVLGGNRESLVGRFVVGSSSDVLHSGAVEAPTGVMVISYLQSMKNKKGCLECRLETDIRRVKDCPLGPLSWQSPKTKDTTSLSARSPTFRPAMASASTMSWTPDRNKYGATGGTSASPTTMSWRTPVRSSKNNCTISSTVSNATSSLGAASPSSSTMSWTPVRSKKHSPETSSASPTTVMHFQNTPLVEEPIMIRFRQSLDKKLKETFSGQRDFLEATDLWNEQEGAFGELSYELKRAFVAVVEQAVDMCNHETSKYLVIRKNTASMRKLNKVTIFKNNGVAKRYALQTYGKTRICHYWANGNCIKGDKCSYAHGEHELVRENSPTPAASQDTDRQAKANPSENEEKQKVTGTPLDEGRGTGTVEDAKASEKAASSGAAATGAAPRLTSTIQAGDAMATMANAASELVQDKIAEKVVPSPVTQHVQASVPLVLESTKVVEIAGPVVVPESAAKPPESRRPEELKEGTNEATDDAAMVDVSPEDEFELALESAMAEALEALGVAEEADVGLEATEEKAEEDTATAENASFVLEEKADAVETGEPNEQAVEKETAVPIVESVADGTGESYEEAVETVTASPIVESLDDRAQEVVAASNPSLGPSVGIQKPESAAVDKSGGIGRWGDYDSSSDSDGP